MGLLSWLFPRPPTRASRDAPPEFAAQPDSPFDYRLEYRDPRVLTVYDDNREDVGGQVAALVAEAAA